MKDLLEKIKELKERLERAWPLLNLDKKQEEVEKLQKQMTAIGFWNNQEEAKEVSQQASDLENEINDWQGLKAELEVVEEMAELDKEAKDVNLVKELKIKLKQLEKQFNKLEFSLLLNAENDQENALLAIHAGAGGTDAQDWAEMLLRMYLRFCEKQGWKAEIINISSGQEAGIKSVNLEIKGKNVYGFLKSENGVHRLVRISPFDAEKMRHTSFALVEVLPLWKKEVDLEIKDDDLKVDTFKAGGHGGQGVNTTDSAVRMTHLPTGIVVSCQNERSQQQNKATALKILKAKVKKYLETEIEEEKQKLKGQFTEAAWGNQIRSYVLHPYKMVKDHRTDFEVQDVDKVLDGELLDFIDSFLRRGAQEGARGH